MFIEKLSDTEVLFLSQSILEQVVPELNKLDDFQLDAKVERDIKEGNVVVRFKYDRHRKTIKLTDYEVKIGCALKPSQVKELNKHLSKFLYKKFGDWYLDSYSNNQIRSLNKLLTKNQEQNKKNIEFIKR